jgi:hypothetical protein
MRGVAGWQGTLTPTTRFVKNLSARLAENAGELHIGLPMTFAHRNPLRLVAIA